MASAVFTFFLGFLIIVLFASTILREKQKKADRREKIKNGFGRGEDDIRESSVFESSPYLFDKLSQETEERYIIDDITSSDL